LLVVACSYFTLLLATLVSCAYLRVSPSPKLWVGCLLLVSSSLVTWRNAPGTTQDRSFATASRRASMPKGLSRK